MKRIFFLIIFFLCAWNIQAQQFPSQVWHEGYVVLLSEDTLRGLIKYDLENDLVQVNNHNRVHTFGARKILAFEIFDEGINNYRFFYSLPFKVKPNYETPILFEILQEGSLTLLCREFIIQETIPQFGMYSRMNFRRFRLAYDFYFLKENGKIDKYIPKKSELLYVMKNRSSEVRSFMKKNKLRYDRREDLAKITSYYNSL